MAAVHVVHDKIIPLLIEAAIAFHKGQPHPEGMIPGPLQNQLGQILAYHQILLYRCLLHRMNKADIYRHAAIGRHHINQLILSCHKEPGTPGMPQGRRQHHRQQQPAYSLEHFIMPHNKKQGCPEFLTALVFPFKNRLPPKNCSNYSLKNFSAPAFIWIGIPSIAPSLVISLPTE